MAISTIPAAGLSSTGALVTTNTAVGTNSLQSNNSTAGNNTAFGYQAAYTNVSGTEVTAIGSQAGYNTNTNGAVVFVGYRAGYSNTTGYYNVAVGQQALNSNTTATNNTAIGYQAGYSNVNGYQNTFIGAQAGYSASQASLTEGDNTFVGFYSGRNVSTGVYNTLIGAYSGFNISTGSKNTVVGMYNGNQGGLDIRTQNNFIVMSDGDGNPRGFWDGQGSFRVPKIYTDTTASGANVYLDSLGYFYRSTSALKYKQNVRDLPSRDINKLRAVVYNSKCEGDDVTKDHFGVIADEAVETFPELVSFGDNGEVEGFQYERLTVVLLKAIQEQQAIITDLKARIETLETK